MNIQFLFSSPERIKVLEAIIFSTNSFRVTQVASAAGVNKGLVSQYFKFLNESAILNRSGNDFAIDSTSALTKATRIMININQINTKIFNKYTWVQSVGLYGSCAKGENTDNSDVDLWIRIKEFDDAKQAELRRKLNNSITNPQLLFLTKDKIKLIQKQDPLFYHALVFGSITIYGDSNAIHI